jgi:hypothetical protein
MSEMSLELGAVGPKVRLEQQRYFFDVSLSKLILMSVVTFDLYLLYWFYKHWQISKARGHSVWPWARALFAPLFAYSLFKETAEVGREASVKVSTQPGANALAFFFLQFLWRLPDPLWLLGFTSVLALIPMQQDVRKIHASLDLDPTINDGLTWKNVVGIVLGIICILLVIVGLFLPEPA